MTNDVNGQSMKRVLRELATPLTLGVFAFVATSGTMMFLDVGKPFVKELHEWLGIAFVVVAVLHVAKNASSLRAYARRKSAQAAVLAVVAIGVAMIVVPILEGETRASGSREIVRAVENAPIEKVAPVLGTDVDVLVARLDREGFHVASVDASLADVARAAGREPRDAVRAAMRDVARE